MNICDIESAPMYPVVQSMNFDQDMVKQTLISLNWAMVQEDYIPGTVSSPPHTFMGRLIRSEVLPPTEVQSGELYSDKQISRLSKRKAVVDQLDANRQEFFSGEFDGFVPLTLRSILQF